VTPRRAREISALSARADVSARIDGLACFVPRSSPTRTVGFAPSAKRMEAGTAPPVLRNDSRTDSHKKPAHKHDCCHSVAASVSGCQRPGVLGLALTGILYPRRFLLPVRDARRPLAHDGAVSTSIA